jgi:acetyl-CoA C-acetyltransferase
VNLRREVSIAREVKDELAVSSHQRAVAALEAGLFDDELVALEVAGKNGPTVIDRDEHPRPDTSLERLARLRPVFADRDADATVTAGNASGQNDGAAACLVTTPEHAEQIGLKPRARIVSWALSGLEPARMGLGPVASTATALQRAGLTLADMDLIELNEAFAAQALACMHELELPHERLNVNGGAIALGHPLGCSGARILTTLVHELRRRGGGYGLATMCIGVGQGIATVVEGIGE